MGWFFYGPSVKQSKRRIIMNFMRRQIFATAMAAVTALGSSAAVSAADTKYNLLPNKPFDGTKLNILSVVTPQFDGLMLRDKEFTELTGIETEWTFIPFGSLQ
jgi:multiple sugar transport system substrate-binding protein